MDTKIIQQYGHEIFCYRIKTKRRKIRDQKKGEEKRMIRLNMELDQIKNKQRNLGFVDLHPPIVRGWKRYFVLRDDVARSKYGVFYQRILDKINTTQYSWRKDFKKRKRKGGKKNWIVKEQRLLELDVCQFAKAKFTDKEAAQFDEKYVIRGWRQQKVKVFFFKEPWRFVLRVRPNLITKVKAVDIELEKREEEISNCLDWNGIRGRYCRLIYGSANNGWGKYGIKKWCRYRRFSRYPYKKRSLQHLLNEEWYNYKNNNNEQ